MSVGNFFDAVYSFLSAMYDFISRMASDVLNFFNLLVKVETLPLLLQNYIWSPIAACISVICLVAIIKVALGWGNT